MLQPRPGPGRRRPTAPVRLVAELTARLRSALLDTLPEPVKAQVSVAARALCSLCAAAPAMAPPPALPVWRIPRRAQNYPAGRLPPAPCATVWLHCPIHGRLPGFSRLGAWALSA